MSTRQRNNGSSREEAEETDEDADSASHSGSYDTERAQPKLK